MWRHWRKSQSKPFRLFPFVAAGERDRLNHFFSNFVLDLFQFVSKNSFQFQIFCFKKKMNFCFWNLLKETKCPHNFVWNYMFFPFFFVLFFSTFCFRFGFSSISFHLRSSFFKHLKSSLKCSCVFGSVSEWPYRQTDWLTFHHDFPFVFASILNWQICCEWGPCTMLDICYFGVPMTNIWAKSCALDNTHSAFEFFSISSND